MREQVIRIADEIRKFLERTPPQVRANIMSEGIYLTGGSTQLPGLDRFLSGYLGCPVQLSQYFDLCTICGAEGTDQPSGTASLGFTRKNDIIDRMRGSHEEKKKFHIKADIFWSS